MTDYDDFDGMNDNSDDKLSNKLRAAEEIYTETPRTEAWHRLEKKLVKARKSRMQRSLISSPAYSTTIVILLLLCATAAWFIIHDKAQREKSFKEFSELKKLQGVWECRDGKTIDVIHWNLINDSSLQATKIIFYENEKNNLIQNNFSIVHAQKNNFFSFDDNIFTSDKNYFFKKNNSIEKNKKEAENKFFFTSKDKKYIEISIDSLNKSFSLKVDDGALFLYRKIK